MTARTACAHPWFTSLHEEDLDLLSPVGYDFFSPTSSPRNSVRSVTPLSVPWRTRSASIGFQRISSRRTPIHFAMTPAPGQNEGEEFSFSQETTIPETEAITGELDTTQSYDDLPTTVQALHLTSAAPGGGRLSSLPAARDPPPVQPFSTGPSIFVWQQKSSDPVRATSEATVSTVFSRHPSHGRLSIQIPEERSRPVSVSAVKTSEEMRNEHEDLSPGSASGNKRRKDAAQETCAH